VLFKDLHHEGQTIIIVTHEEDVAGHAHRIVRLKDGKVISDHPTKSDPIHQAYLGRALEIAKAKAQVLESQQIDTSVGPSTDPTLTEVGGGAA